MGKKKYSYLISPLSIHWPYFSLYKTNKDETLIFRCKYCFKCRIKKQNELLFRLSGHDPKCFVITKLDIKKKISKFNDLNKPKNIINNKRKIVNEDINKENYNLKNNLNYLDKFKYSECSNFRENENYILFKNFIICKKKMLGEGTFIKTYLGYDTKNEEQVAVKLSKEKAKITSVLIEIMVLRQTEGTKGFPKVKEAFKYYKKEVVIQTLLGPSLDKLLKFYGSTFSLKTICLIGIQILERLESLHDLGLLHNDLKPSNLSWGTVKNGEIFNKKNIFLIDFGLASRYKYIVGKDNNELNNEENNNLESNTLRSTRVLGNLDFMSEEVLLENNPSPKTELESFIYLIIFFFKRELPWSNIKAKNHSEKRNKIIEIHKKTTKKNLCSELPYQIVFIYNDIKESNLDERPKYELYKTVLKETIFLIDNKKTKEFCWEKKISDYQKKEKKNFIDNYLFI